MKKHLNTVYINNQLYSRNQIPFKWFQNITNDIEKFKDYINQGVDINIQDNLGNTALIYTSYHGKKEIVELLKQPNININIQNNDSYTALMIASFNGHKEIVKLLLKHPDINVNIINEYDVTFIAYLSDKSFLIDYQLQKQIIYNERVDIILFLNKYNLTHPDIKKENPELFQASDWGLI